MGKVEPGEIHRRGVARAARPSRIISLAVPTDVEGWRTAARALDREGVPPHDVEWRVAGEAATLFDGPAGYVDAVDTGPAGPTETGAEAGASAPVRRTVPKAFVELAETVICHSATDRFALLYRLLWRLRDAPGLLQIPVDPDVHQARTYEKSVRRDCHKMRAFVRFRETADPDGVPRFVAWFEPEHHIVERNAGFFVRRFAGQRFSILTPTRSLHWDGAATTFSAGVEREDAPVGDDMEALWKVYFASIFNPARLKVKAMTAEMPKKYWKNLPEAELIDPLIREAGRRTSQMVAAEARPPARSTRVARKKEDERRMADGAVATTLDDLTRLEAACERCPLFETATQVVPGEGPADASMMLVGEQPGDQEDLVGRPFVGPAGQLLDRALGDAGIDREQVFVTNAVKHFKFTPRGKRRIHQKPNVTEIDHCRWWLDQERRLVRPKLTVALGATAVRALAGRTVSIASVRGAPITWADGGAGFVTVHPSYLLRLPDPADKAREYDRFVADLARAKGLVDRG